VAGGAAPDVADQQRLELGAHEAHLRRELHRLLAQVRQRLDEVGSQDHDRLARQQPDLRAAEGDDVGADVRRDRPQRRVQRGGGVGQPSAVDVEQHPVLVRVRGERRHLRRRVERPELRRLRDRDHTGLDDVLVADPHEPRLDELRRQLAVGRRDGQQLDPGERLRGAALVDVQVRALGAHDTLPGAQHRAQADDVRAGAVEDREDVGFGAERLAHARAQPRGHLVGAIGDGVPVVGGGDRRQRLGQDGGIVVTREGTHARRR
jgi:hypothetical protein